MRSFSRCTLVFFLCLFPEGTTARRTVQRKKQSLSYVDSKDEILSEISTDVQQSKTSKLLANKAKGRCGLDDEVWENVCEELNDGDESAEGLSQALESEYPESAGFVCSADDVRSACNAGSHDVADDDDGGGDDGNFCGGGSRLAPCSAIPTSFFKFVCPAPKDDEDMEELVEALAEDKCIGCDAAGIAKFCSHGGAEKGTSDWDKKNNYCNQPGRRKGRGWFGTRRRAKQSCGHFVSKGGDLGFCDHNSHPQKLANDLLKERCVSCTYEDIVKYCAYGEENPSSKLPTHEETPQAQPQVVEEAPPVVEEAPPVVEEAPTGCAKVQPCETVGSGPSSWERICDYFIDYGAEGPEGAIAALMDDKCVSCSKDELEARCGSALPDDETESAPPPPMPPPSPVARKPAVVERPKPDKPVYQHGDKVCFIWGFGMQMQFPVADCTDGCNYAAWVAYKKTDVYRKAYAAMEENWMVANPSKDDDQCSCWRVDQNVLASGGKASAENDLFWFQFPVTAKYPCKAKSECMEVFKSWNKRLKDKVLNKFPNYETSRPPHAAFQTRCSAGGSAHMFLPAPGNLRNNFQVQQIITGRPSDRRELGKLIRSINEDTTITMPKYRVDSKWGRELDFETVCQIKEVKETCDYLEYRLGYQSIDKFHVKLCTYDEKGGYNDEDALEECGMPKEGDDATIKVVGGIKKKKTSSVET